MLSAMALSASPQVSATAQPTSLMPVSGTQAAMPAIQPLSPVFSCCSSSTCMHTYIHTYIPPQSLEPQGIWHCAQETGSAEGKDKVASGRIGYS